MLRHFFAWLAINRLLHVLTNLTEVKLHLHGDTLQCTPCG